MEMLNLSCNGTPLGNGNPVAGGNSLSNGRPLVSGSPLGAIVNEQDRSGESEAILKIAKPPEVSQRLSEVRQQQGVSVRSVARKLGVTMQEVRQQEQPDADIRLSDLLMWQQVLDVPLADLLVDDGAPLSPSVNQRASLLRVMKTAKALSENVKEAKSRRMAEMLVDQLIKVMPELEEVSAWHSVGQRRTQDEIGRTGERTIPDSLFND
ncbi:helix-turn-helix domain-containing protein [Adhaeretor mobilis]|uniref:HTH cro/C1-type domain-containing protein n=1 Tax=Adhaeretor mobilis TaxID=1930276 RepID=A0A517MR78_9BACT|nr:helix-turn-helix domain-containing protein [Adhaeretor mobilis]QDS97376.1 hypothetical protein HG15A2_06370 [Adhaeretor mobilis]